MCTVYWFKVCDIALKWALDGLYTINLSRDIVLEIIARGSDLNDLWKFEIQCLKSKST